MLWELQKPDVQQEKVPREGPCAGVVKPQRHLGQGTLANILSPSFCPSLPCGAAALAFCLRQGIRLFVAPKGGQGVALLLAQGPSTVGRSGDGV